MGLSCTPRATSASRSAATRRSAADRRHHPVVGRLRLRLRPVALPRRRDASTEPAPMGHEYVGIVEEVGSEVRTSSPASSWSARSSPPTTPARSARPATRAAVSTASSWARSATQARVAARSRSPTAPWSPPQTCPTDDLVPSLLAASDVLGTGWFAAVAAEAGPGKTVAVVGDGAVGLLAVLAARQLGAERIIAMSRHESRQQLAREFGATDIVTERGDAGVAADQGADRRARRALGHRGRRHPGVDDAGHPLRPARRARRLRRRRPRRGAARRGVVLRRGAPARRPGAGAPVPARPDRSDLATAPSTPAWSSTSTCRWTEAAEGYRAMDERRAIKTLLRP